MAIQAFAQSLRMPRWGISEVCLAGRDQGLPAAPYIGEVAEVAIGSRLTASFVASRFVFLRFLISHLLPAALAQICLQTHVAFE